MTVHNTNVYLVLLALLAVALLGQGQTSEVSYSIKEELAPGTVFGYIVDDSDLKRKVSPDELGNLRFSFLTTGNPNSKFFSIDKKAGILAVSSRIDRETVCSFRHDCILTISAVVQSELGPFFHIITVQIEVTDVNDNTPTFSQALFQVTIPENAALGRTFPLPTAFDKDTGANNTVQDYFVLSSDPPSSPFSLSTTRDDVGNVQTSLQLVRELNREDTSTITVMVGARDGGRPPLTGTLTVRVDVADVNDNYPVFDRYAYNLNVSETTRTNHPLIKVHAEDADVGPNGNLSYTFSQLQPQEVLDLFRMDEFSGTMYLARSVENHTGQIFELVVEASDQGAPPKVSRALVRVRVLDTVNSRPDIIVDILSSGPDGQSEVSEYAEVGKVVAYVSVTDRDSGENGVTVCRLNTKDFELQPLNNQGQYKVILVTNLDRETIARYQISVSCTDFGFPPLESAKTFQVIVRDENDNSPQFSQVSYRASVQENSTAGAIVTTLSVRDKDEGLNAQVTFRVAGTHRNDFKIFDNGTMIALIPLDREISENLMVKVVAVDKGFPALSGSSTVYITLEDVNDMPPSFRDQGYSFSVPEDASIGSYVGIVAARDGDKGRNAEISFAPLLEGRHGGNAFNIDEEGVIRTSRALDREKKSLYLFTIVARDGGSPSLSSTTTLTIRVDDVNDNTPTFLYPSQMNDTLSIPHTFPLRASITTIKATDKDAGKNSALVYSCASANDSGLFGMDPKTGDLFLQRYISRRQIGMYVLRVAAHDEGTPQLSNQTLLYLDVYFDNSTLLDPAQAAAPSRTLVTVLVVVGVVVVVALVAITTLICIRRQEARKKQAASSGDQQATPTKLQGGYYIAPGVCESPAFGGALGNGALLHKPVPEQSLDGSGGGGSVTGMGHSNDSSLQRNGNPYVIMPPHNTFSEPDGPPEIIEISRNGLFHRAEDPYPDDDSDRADDNNFSTFRSTEGALNANFQQNSFQRNSLDGMDEDKRADDTLSLSELSYQSTSDSGRGGSEFDVNNAGHKEKLAKIQATSSPISKKGVVGNSFHPRDPEVSFTTFRGESPCSFRFDPENDTLNRAQRPGNMPRASPVPLSSKHVMQPHARSLHSLAGAAPQPTSHPYQPRFSSGGEPAGSEDGNSLGRRSNAMRRAITPGADFTRYGYVSGSGPGYAPAAGPSQGTRPGGQYGSNYDSSRVGGTFSGLSSFGSAPASTHLGSYTALGNTGPSSGLRGRSSLGMPATRRQTSEYANAYSDLDSGDDTHQGSELEPSENDSLLPPYPDLLEEEEEGGYERDVSERSALNFVPGVSNTSRSSEDSYRMRRSSEV